MLVAWKAPIQLADHAISAHHSLVLYDMYTLMPRKIKALVLRWVAYRPCCAIDETPTVVQGGSLAVDGLRK